MGGAGPTHFLREKPWGRGWRIMNSHKTTVTAFCFYLLIWQSIASSTRKCSRLLDSGEEAKVKNAWKVGGAGKRKKEGRQSFRPPPLLSPVSSCYIFVFVLSQFSGPNYLGAWNRLTRNANDRTFSSIFLFRITLAASPVIEISSVSNFMHISLPKFFYKGM